MIPIKTVTIVGVGLIGGSLGLAIRKKHIARRVIGFGRNLKRLREAKNLGAVDYITTDIKDAISDADLVVFCLPVELIIKFAKEIKPFFKKECIITDVGSTKKKIVNNLTNIFSDKVYFVGAHPLAGSHKSGVKFAKQDLFKNTTCVITPVRSTNKQSCKVVKSLWNRVGAKVFYLSPVEHDKLVSLTSHLPHLAAVSLTNTVLENNIKKIKELLATGFKDTTRIAASEPVLWKDICFTNRTNIIKSMDKFEKHIAEIKNALKKNNEKSLLSLFESAKRKREKI